MSFVRVLMKTLRMRSRNCDLVKLASLEWFSKLISEMDADLLASGFVVEPRQDRCGYCLRPPPRLKPKSLAPYRKFLSRITLTLALVFGGCSTSSPSHYISPRI